MFSRAAGARASAKWDFFHRSISFVETVNLFYWSEALQSHFEVAYVVSVTRFRALRARARAKRDFFFMNEFLLPRRFQ